MKKFKGFTLIELIVVIAIIGVLCAILVPTMMGWVTKSRVKTNNANAKQTFTACQEAITDADNHGWDWTAYQGKNVTSGTTSYTAPTKAGEKVDLAGLTNSLNTASTNTASWAVSVTKDGGATRAIFSTNGSNYTGRYPDEIEETKNENYSTNLLTVTKTNNT